MAENNTRSKHIASRILYSLLTAVAAVLLIIQIPSVQTKIASAVLDKLNGTLGGELSAGEFRLLPFNTIAVSDFLISGGPEDTLVYARSAVLQFSLRSVTGKTPRFHKGTINEGFFNLKAEGDSININRIFPRKHKVKTGKDIICFSNLSADGLNVRVSGFGETFDFDLNTNLRASNFKVKDDGISCRIDNFNCVDESGITIQSLKTKLSAGKKGIEIDELLLKDGFSNLDIPHFLVEFGEQMAFDGKIKNTSISSKTVERFVPAIKKTPIELNINELKLAGPLNDIQVSKFAFNESNYGISADLSCNVRNLPYMQGAIIDLDVKKLIATFHDIEYTFSGKADGPINNITADGELKSPTGNLVADLVIKNIIGNSTSSIEGSVIADNFDVSGIIGNSNIGICTIDASGSAAFGDKLNSLSVNNLSIDRFDAFGYTYNGIKGSGTYSENSFNGKIVSEDPNLDFKFDGICNLGKNIEDALYKFHLNLRNADLQKLNLDKRGTSKASLELQADFNGSISGDLLGTIDILGIKLENNAGIHDIGDISINSRTRNGSYSLDFHSGFVDASYQGAQTFTKVIDDIKCLTVGKHAPALLANAATSRDDNDDFTIDLGFHDSRDLLSFAVPGLYIADSTKINLSVDCEGKVFGRVNSSRLALKNNYLKNFTFEIDNEGESLNAHISSSENKLAGLLIKNSSISAFAKENRIGLSLEYDNKTESENKAEILLSGLLERDQMNRLYASAENLASVLWYEGTAWKIEPTEYAISKEGIEVKNLTIESGDQSLILYGGFSNSNADTLKVGMSNFNLSMLTSLLGDKIKLGGSVTGSASISSPVSDNFGLVANLSCENTSLSDLEMGTLDLSSSWDDELRGISFNIANKLEGIQTISASGILSTENKNLDAEAKFQSFNIGYAKPFIESVFSDIGGGLNGTIRIKGPLDRLDISSKNTRIENGFLKIDYTNVLYKVNGPFHLTRQGVFFDNIALSDSYKGNGFIRGGFNFNDFKAIEANTRIQFTNTELVNLEISSGDVFYGHLFGSGSLSINGPLSSIVLDGEATTSREGNFHLPLGNIAGSSSSNLLTFKEDKKYIWEDPYLQMISDSSKKKAGKGSLGLRMRVRVTPDINMFLELDKAGDNVLSGQGNGYVDIEAGMKDNPFSINGDYTLQNGKYHLALLGIAKKDFDIKDGSSIKFIGDIMDSDLDIDAIYNTKTSISTLIADTTSVAARRNVECGLRIYDKLRNPQLEFSIDIPDLDPTIKSRVESALNTNDKIQKQFLSLLVTNSFLPDEQSGIVNNTNMLYSNVSEIMSNQLNNILQKLEIPFDLGLSYQSGQGGTNIFDVAISTQLFNNRVLVNGNIGNRQYNNSTNQDVVGDLDIEIKLDRTGAVRMNLFSHSADDYTNFLDNLQRNGIGVAYQKEFNSIRQVFSRRASRRGPAEFRKRTDSIMHRTDTLRRRPDSLPHRTPRAAGRSNQQTKTIVIE